MGNDGGTRIIWRFKYLRRRQPSAAATEWTIYERWQMCPVTFFQTKTVKRLLKPRPPPAIFFIRPLPNIPHFAFFIQKTCISFYSSNNGRTTFRNWRTGRINWQCNVVQLHGHWEMILCSLPVGRHYTDIMLANVVPLSLHATSGIYQYIPTTRYSNEQI